MSAVLEEIAENPKQDHQKNETKEGVPSEAASPKRHQIQWNLVVPIFTLIVVAIIFALAEETFLSQRNLTNLARQVSVNCILAFGMTCIILLGAIDLSIGSVLALGSVVAGLLQVSLGLSSVGFWGALATYAAVVAVCGLVGAFTGGMVAKFKMPPFVVSLGVFVIARGIALILSGGAMISPLSEHYRWMGNSFVSPFLSSMTVVVMALLATASLVYSKPSFLAWRLSVVALFAAAAFWVFGLYQGIPMPVVVMCLVFGVTYFFLNRTTYGRFIYAIGGNPEAARLCGIRVPLVFFLTFVYMGALVGLAAIIEGGRVDAGDPTAGNLYELDAIAAVVIGGTSLQGGVGRVGGTLLGAFLMGTVNNGMSLMNVPTNWQMVIKGLIIISAVLVDVISKKQHR